MNQEQRRSPRLNTSLPLRVTSADGMSAAITGETRDMGAGVVGIVVPFELPVGKAIGYEITLSTCGAGARIRCAGVILRCVREGEAWKVAATMTRYHFIGASDAECAHAGTTADTRGECRPADNGFS